MTFLLRKQVQRDIWQGIEMGSIDLSLYLIVGLTGLRHDLLTLAEAAVAGGATVVQLREKHAPVRDIVAAGRALKTRLRVPLIVNDRIDVAFAIGADGVHLGQDDLPAEQARQILGDDTLIGLSAGDLVEAARVDPDLVDYVGVGPAYPTGSKADAGAAIGPEGIARLRGALPIPLVAIGGIDETNAAAVMATGVNGIAVISAICGADDPALAARRLRDIVDRSKTA